MLRRFFGLPASRANQLVLTYCNEMRFRRQFAPATVNRRLAVVRSLVRMARMVGLVP